MADALTATELVLAREQHLSQLDGLAAAAAHELGTPLSTIAVVAKELQHALGPDSPHADDVKLLREQAQRCREILGKLSALPADGAPFQRAKLSVLIEEVVAPHRNFGIAIDVVLPPRARRRAGGRALARDPLRARQSGRERGRLRGASASRSRCAGASRMSRSRSRTTGRASRRKSSRRIGEPYVTSRRRTGARKRGKRARPGLFHRQDAAGALRRDARVPQPASRPTRAPWCACAGRAAISRRRRRRNAAP